jgi:integrase
MTNMQTLTTALIDGLTCPEGKKNLIVFDAQQRGLAVRVTGRNNTKSYFVQYAYGGQRQRVPLGSYNSIPLAQARKLAAQVMVAKAAGGDPATERKARENAARKQRDENALTLEVLIEQFARAPTKKGTDKSERHAREAARALQLMFPAHLKRPAGGLDRKTVVRAHDAAVAKGNPIAAARTVAYGKAAFNWAIRRGSLEINPFANLQVALSAKRERVLADDELKAVWGACEGMGTFGAIVRMLVLTGQRREEVASMTWGELSPDLTAWTLPSARTKNNVTHILPLSEQARTIVAAQVRGAGDDLVFPGRNGKTPFSGFSKAKIALDRASRVTDWTIHDLRRTTATGLQRLGVRLEVSEACLNHISGSKGGIAGVYHLHNWTDEKRAALAAWGAKVEAIVAGGEHVGNVVQPRSGV